MPDLFIGLMSGTSMDALDAVAARFFPSFQLVGTHSSQLPSSLRRRLLALSTGEQTSLEELGELDIAFSRFSAEVVEELIQASGIDREQIAAVGSHGQTVRHRPDGPFPFTLQLGDPNLLAELTGLNIVADFRRRDMAAGGQGAPLVPAFHAANFSHPEETRVVLNLGGIANITLLSPQQPIRGFDTGPANTLLDAWTARHLSESMDKGGAWAATGNVHQPLLRRLLDDPYFHRPPPKSTGREHFNLAWLEPRLGGLSPQDVQATLLELTAVTVSDAINAHAPEATRVLVCGGGAFNQRLMERLGDRLGDRIVETTHSVGLEPQWVEACAFAWLAHQRLQGLTGNLPEVTGAHHPVILGGLYPGSGSLSI